MIRKLAIRGHFREEHGCNLRPHPQHKDKAIESMDWRQRLQLVGRRRYHEIWTWKPTCQWRVTRVNVEDPTRGYLGYDMKSASKSLLCPVKPTNMPWFVFTIWIFWMGCCVVSLLRFQELLCFPAARLAPTRFHRLPATSTTISHNSPPSLQPAASHNHMVFVLWQTN